MMSKDEVRGRLMAARDILNALYDDLAKERDEERARGNDGLFILPCRVLIAESKVSAIASDILLGEYDEEVL